MVTGVINQKIESFFLFLPMSGSHQSTNKKHINLIIAKWESQNSLGRLTTRNENYFRRFHRSYIHQFDDESSIPFSPPRWTKPPPPQGMITICINYVQRCWNKLWPWKGDLTMRIPRGHWMTFKDQIDPFIGLRDFGHFFIEFGSNLPEITGELYIIQNITRRN